MSQTLTQPVADRAPVAPLSRTEKVTALATLVPLVVHLLYLLAGRGAANPFDVLGMMIDALYLGSMGATAVALLIMAVKRISGRELPTRRYVTIALTAVGLHLVYAFVVLPALSGT